MEIFIKIVISTLIQVIFLIIAIGINHTFPSLNIIPYWILGFISGMIVMIVYDEMDDNEI